MADRNNKAEEDYLDSLLRSLTGEADNPEDEKKIEEEMSLPEKDVDADVDADGLDEQFLSEFEKEFFNDGETELLENDVMGQEEINKLADDINEQKNSFEEHESKNLHEEPEKFEEEPKVTEEEIPDEALFDLDSDILGAIDEAVAESGNEEERKPENEEKNLVDEAISKEDSSVEDDLQGLYDILGVENDGSELPENVEEIATETSKKKKGLFSRKDKKEKKAKKEKSKKEKQADNAGDSEEVPGESIDIASLFAEEQNQDIPVLDDTGDFGLGLDDSASGDDAGDNQDFGFGLDDSSFDDMDENERLIQQMDDGEIDEDELLEEDDESDKKKKKKEKKEKKEKKKKKEKAPKKKKPKKEKKEKKPKEPDEIIHIPVVFLVFALSFVVVAVLAAKFGGDYYYYNQQFYEAISLYVYGNELEEGEVLDQKKYESKFNEAYTLLNGLEMKTKDHQAFFDQLETIMLMDRHYEAYKSYMMMGDYEHGLDSLIKAVKMYDKYQNKARDLKCFDEMTLVLSWVDDKLSSTYGISESQARELHMIADDDEYAVQVRTIAAKARALHGNNTDGEE